MLTFNELELKNYKSFEKAKISLDNQGLTLIEGVNNTNDSYASNGSGKSSLLEGITYALYGKTASKIKADEVINRNVGKNTMAKVTFEQNGVTYEVVRYRKHYRHKNKVTLHRDGENLTAKSTKDTDALIEEIIGIDYDVWANSIFYGQGETELFAQATDKNKKEILESITSIGIYGKAQEVAKEKVKEKQLEEDEVNHNVDQAKAKIEMIEQAVEEAFKQYEHTETLINNKKQELKEAKQALKDFPQKQLNDLKKKFKELDDYTIPDFAPDTFDDGALQEAYASVGVAEQALEEIKQKENAFNQQISTIQGQVQAKKQQQASLDTAENCPTCGAPIDASSAKHHYDELEKEIQELNAQIQTFIQQGEQVFTPAVQAAQDELSECKAVFEERQKEERDYSIQVEQQRQEHNTMVAEYNQEHSEWANQIQVYENKKAQLEQNVQTTQSQLDDLDRLPKPNKREEEIKEIEKEIGQHKDDLDTLFVSKNNYEKAVKAFSNSGIRSMVLDLVTPALTNNANKYLTELTDSYIQVNFTTQVENQDGSLADKFDVQVTNGGEETTYQSLSQGEKTRVDVAISLAIQDLVYSNSQLEANIALYDEVFDGLDEVGTTAIINILEDKAREIGSIFVITHSNTMKPLFENVITVEKGQDGNSVIKT